MTKAEVKKEFEFAIYVYNVDLKEDLFYGFIDENDYERQRSYFRGRLEAFAEVLSMKYEEVLALLDNANITNS